MVKFVIWYLYEITFGMAFFVFVFVFVFYLLGKTLLNLCKNDTLPSYYLNVRRAVILTFLEGYVAYLYNKPRQRVGERRREFFFVTAQISKEQRFVLQRT